MTNNPTSHDIARQAREIVEQLGGRWQPRGAMCRCPAHDDSSPSLSVRVGDRSVLLHCFGGCDTRDVLRALRGQRIGGGRMLSSAGPVSQPDTQARDAWLREQVARLWSEARQVLGTPAETYLARHRRIEGPYRDMRFHPRTPLGPKPVTIFRPALLVAVRSDEGLVALQRIFLDPGTGGKALDVGKPKKMLGTLGTGAARFGIEAGETLGLAEGTEDALSATQLTGVPTWATMGTDRFGVVVIPDKVRRVIVFAQNDHGGSIAVERAQQFYRLEGREILVRRPLEPRCKDWNDILMKRA